MTTPDKEEMPTEDRTPVLPVRLEQPWAGFSCLHIGSFKIGIAVTDEDGTQDPDAAGTALEAWVTACNAYEPMKEALEKVMVGGNHLGLIIGADHPPYTASHEEARTHYADAIWTYEAWCCWKTIMEARPALSTLPVNDRHHSGSDSYQADASAPALSEKFNLAGEWLPIASAPKDGTKIDLLYPYPRGRTINCYWGETDLHCGPLWVKRNPTWGASGLLPEREWSTSCFPNMEPTHWMPAPALPDGWLNFSNEPESDGVSLKSDTSSQPASEAGAK